MTPDTFAGLMDILIEKNYTFLSMDEVHELLIKRRQIRKVVAVTFDDGYKDTFEYALPVLQERNIPVAVYVMTGDQNEILIPWLILLMDVIYQHSVISFTIENNVSQFRTDTSYGKKTAINSILDLIFSSEKNQIAHLRKIIHHISPGSKPPQNILLPYDKLQHYNKNPLVTIGAHGIDHSNLKALNKPDVEKQFNDSKKCLEKVLGSPVVHFAYPYGGREFAGTREFQLAKEAGYLTAVTTRYGHIFPGHAEFLMCLPRISIGPAVCGDSQLFQFLMNGCIAMMKNKGKRFITA
ncbi:MAG: polysaccharide deacetylase family protein [Candidatus Latescibacteria bacterium]|nr:polysaccharide deacetylase family protein [Candidatus Latescibacterota bacterium]